ncbi:hypothetical protein MAUB1S_08495 [Mycolicibacterium aubagnense]
MAGLRKRQNVFKLGGDWADPILWYARAVKAMRARPFSDTTSWRFYASIHGVSQYVWTQYGYLRPSDALPGANDVAAYINQCQHQSWFFLPWHRGYLLALEKVLRNEIRLLGGPHESWALPYWNYFAPGQNVLPPAFLSRNWPDGAGDNPLFVEQRYGEIVTQAPFDIGTVTNLDSMGDDEFFGPGGGGTAGFGGPITGFNWNSGTNGGLEADPHNQIHGLVGGEHPTLTYPNGAPMVGLMGSPISAALDPIFYLHHCNIDRLWESWNKFPAGKVSRRPISWQNPTQTLWLDGPTNVGQHEFAMPNPDASKWVYTPNGMQDIAVLGYEYDSLDPAADVSADPLGDRLVTLGLPADRGTLDGVLAVGSSSRTPEMIGAGEGLSLAGSAPVLASVRTEPAARRRVVESFSTTAHVPPDRVFLNFENITGLSDAVIVKVYVGLPGSAGSASDRQFAGSISTFGLAQASDPNGLHVGNGITYTLEITKIVDQLHLKGEFDVDDLAIELVPLRNIPTAAQIKIGRISLYRQAA